MNQADDAVDLACFSDRGFDYRSRVLRIKTPNCGTVFRVVEQDMNSACIGCAGHERPLLASSLHVVRGAEGLTELCLNDDLEGLFRIIWSGWNGVIFWFEGSCFVSLL